MSKAGGPKVSRPMKGNENNISIVGPAGSAADGISAQNNNATPNQQTNPIPTTQPTDSYIPTYLSNLVPELRSYEQLIESERKVDVYLARKKIDLHQSVSQWNNSKTAHGSHNKNEVQYLRVFISNISENQPWQAPEGNISNATWTMRIEGRLLDAKDVQDPDRPKFSSFLQAIAVDFKKSKKKTIEDEKSDDQDVEMAEVDNADNTNMLGLSLPLQLPEMPGDFNNAPGSITTNNITSDDQPVPNENDIGSEIADAVEWHFDPKNPVDFDGLDIKRPGSETIDCTITIQPKGLTGERLEYSPNLAATIGLSQGSLHEAVYSLYKYILMNDLLVNDEANVKTTAHNSSDNTNGEKTMVQLDDTLLKLLGNKSNSEEESGPAFLRLSEIPPLVNSNISPIPPIKIDYTIRVDKASTYGELVFDLEVPNPTQEQQEQKTQEGICEEGVSLLSEFNKLSTELKTELQDLDSRTNTLQLQLNASANKYQFYNKLSLDPAHVLQEYMASTANALKVLSGDEGFNEDMVRRSQFYSDNESLLFENLSVLLANGRM